MQLVHLHATSAPVTTFTRTLRFSLLVFWSLALPASLLFPRDATGVQNPPAGGIGVYFDASYTQTVLDDPPAFILTDFWVVISDIDQAFPAAQLSGYELTLNVPAEMVVTNRVMNPGTSINFGNTTTNNWIVTTGFCVDPDLDGNLQILQYTFIFLAEPIGYDLVLDFAPSNPSTFVPPTPGWIECSDDLYPFAQLTSGMVNPCPADSVLYVDATAPAGGDGESWLTAFADLQDGLWTASQCPGVTELWVAAGTYTSTTGVDRAASFSLVNGVRVYGGFDGTETDVGQRDWVTNVTTLSGDIGVSPDVGDNSYHVVVAMATDGTTVLDGFTIEAGNADGSGDANSGHGAGMFVEDGGPLLSNLTFTSGSALTGGGGLAVFGMAIPTLSDVTFTANSTSNDGGGMIVFDSAPRLQNVTFFNNSAAVAGGGLHNTSGSDATLIGVTFIGNQGDGGGGGLDNVGSSATLTNVEFVSNQSQSGYGGAITNRGGTLILTTGLFSANTSCDQGPGSLGGGAIYSDWIMTLVNATFSDNTTCQSGGAIHNDAGDLTLTNSILWGDSATLGSNELHNTGTAAISNSVIEGSGGSGAGWDVALGVDGGFNYDLDPLFVDALGGDFRLTIGSVAMNGGLTSALPPTATTDLDGNLRIIGESVDMGAYELLDELLITSIQDVANDQGRSVRIGFDASSLDVIGSAMPILQYEAFRRIDPLPKRSGKSATSQNSSRRDVGGEDSQSLAQRIARARASGMVSDATILSLGWDYAGSVPAHTRSSYNMIAPTLADSTVQGMHWSIFFMRAATAQPIAYFDSPADSGYSVDNLAPSVPENISAAYDAAGVGLAWDDVPEEDLRYYRIYRSAEGPDFVPTPTDLVGESAVANWTDSFPTPWGFYYKIAAVDHAGNEGQAGSPITLTDIADAGTPFRFALHDAVPNPFNPSTTLSFEMAAVEHVQLSVYDLAGRRVATLVDEVRGAGRHDAVWNGFDGGGRPVASGVYLYRITTASFATTKRMLLLK